MGLDDIRQKIDAVDTQMKKLFLERMELAYQVVETKKQTGGKVYVPEREKEIIANRSKDVDAEYIAEYKALIKQMMAISRTYQYSQLEDAQKMLKLPEGVGEVTVTIPMTENGENIAVCMNAILLAGLQMCEMQTVEKENGKVCKMRVQGDFSKTKAKAAILMITEENL